MRTLVSLVLSLVLTFICVSVINAQDAAGAQNEEKAFSTDNARLVTSNGDWRLRNNPVTIAGKLFDDHIDAIYFGDRFVSLDIRGWDGCRMFIGISDDNQGSKANVSIELDGKELSKYSLQHGKDPVLIEIPFNNGKVFTVKWVGALCVASPRLINGKVGNTPNPQPTTGITQLTVNNLPPTFVIDPNDIDKLATALRKRIDGKPELKKRVDEGQIALMSFSLINVSSAAVAQTVAENLSTSLINLDFPLIERGQLDKVLKELKIQDTALVDPTTAQQIGKLTGCNMILLGSISDQGQFVVINARLLDTATGKALAAERVEMRKIEIKQ